MTEIFVVGKRMESSYIIDFRMDSFFFPVKLDTGAKRTVFSAGVFEDDLTQEKLERIKDYCEKRAGAKEQFISASGDSFWGYLTTAKSVRIGSTIFHDFRFYLVIENKRDIALLGYDFIDRCTYSHILGGDIIVTAVNEVGYGELEGAMQSDEVFAFIDSLSD